MSGGNGAAGGPGGVTVDLFAPGMTALHRVGLAGLAMTLQALAEDGTDAELRALGAWEIGDRAVRLRWDGDGAGFFAAVLARSFRLTGDGLLWFPALGHPREHLDQAAVLHEAVLRTFLQHGRSRGAAGAERGLSVEVDEVPYVVRFRPLAWYAHQRARFAPSQPFPVAGWLYPGGAVRHVRAAAATALSEDPARALALLYAPVGAVYFQVHRRTAGVRPQYCLALPEVADLAAYADARRLFLRQGIARLQVAGAAEAAARVLAELEAHNLRRAVGGDRCAVVAFGTAPWSRQQQSRVERFTVAGARRGGLGLYRIAAGLLPTRLVAGMPDPRTGEVRRWWRVPQTPDLVAENVVAGAPWWRGFAGLWERVRQAAPPEQRDWTLRDEREGLHMMVEDARTMPDGPEARLVRACHEAWRRRLGALGERARDQGTDFRALADREYERARIGFARCKNAAMLRQTLTDFWSRAGPLPQLREGWPELLPFLDRRWRDGRDLALLALASYAPHNPEASNAAGAAGPTEGEGGT